jgi:HD-GYP domain-containing protein (c-di-GMP phosphodiesterase class II)
MSGATVSDLIHAMSSVRKSIQLYPPAHPEYKDSVATLVATATECLADGAIVLNRHEGRLYRGSEVIADGAPGMTSLGDAMEARRIESLTIEPGFEEQDAVGLAEVLNLKPSPSLDVEGELASRGVARVRVSSLLDDEDAEREERDRQRDEDRALYRHLLSRLRSLAETAQSGDAPQVSQAGPMVQGILERLLEDDAAVLGLATMNAKSEQDLMHAVNVMIYSLTLGTGLGIPQDGLTSLGLSALVHDIGKVAFDSSDPGQAEAMGPMHPTIGADLLSRLPDEERTPMLVAYEHHMHFDGSGYPVREEGYVPHPYSRMVAVANRYDRLTKQGPDGEPLSPDRAVMQILREAGTVLDPFYTRLFVKALGVFPIGCVVRLSDHAVGVVAARGSHPLRPTVRLVFDATGTRMDDPVDLDLSEDERTIVEVVEAGSLQLEVADCL